MADFRIRVVIDPTAAIAGANRVERRMASLGRSATALRAQFATILGAGGALIAFAAGTRVLAGFEQTMSTVRAIAGATDEQFAQLTDTARELGATTRFTASQAGEALLFLSRAGFDVNESLETVGATLNLAQAGALDLGRAADIASNVLQGFRLETSEANRVVDVLALAANSANTNVNQLGQALSFAAPVAAALGVSVEETSAAIGALSNSAIQSTRAGTGLLRVLTDLESPSNVAAEIFKNLDVKLADIKPSVVGLTQALTVLRDVGLDATTGAFDAFGKRGGLAFEVLAASIPTVVELTEKLKNAEGTAARVAKIMDDNLNGALLRVKSAAEAVVLSFGKLGGSGFLRGFFEGLAGALRGLASNLEIITRLFKTFILVLSVAFSQRAVPLAVGAFNALTAAAVRFNLVILLNPLVAFAAAIALVVGVIVSFRDKIKLTSDGAATLNDLFTVLGGTIKEGFAGAILLARTVLAGFAGAFGLVFADFEFSVAGAIRILARLVDFISNTFDLILRTTGAFARNFPSVLKETFIDALNFLLPVLDGITNAVVKALNIIPGIDIALFKSPKLENSARGAGQRLANELVAGLNTSFSQTTTLDAVNRLLDETERLAQSRLKVPDPDPTPDPTPDPGAGAPSGGGGIAKDLKVILDQLTQQEMLLRLTNSARQIQNELLAIEEELNRKLVGSEIPLVEARLRELQALQGLTTIFDELRGPREELIQQQELLNELIKAGTGDQALYNEALLVLQQRSAEASNTFSGGLAAGLLEISSRLQDVGRNVQQFVVGAFDSATDAIVNFATTGRFEFRAFVADLLQQLAKLALQLALTAALKAALTSTGGQGIIGGILKLAVGSQVPGRQNGFDGIIGGSGGTDSQLVAFRGTPGERVQVTTPGQQGGSQQPIVVQAPAVNITNVQSPDDIPLGIESAEGERAVLNVLSRNARAVKALVG